MNIQTDFDLKPYNSFAVSQMAKHFARVECLEDLQLALDYAEQHFLPVHFLGQGSNTLFVQDYPGLIVMMACEGIDASAESGLVTAACGEGWHQLVKLCLEKGLYGLENLALIPGTVGAAPVQNIGAYGVELEQLLHSVKVYNRATATVETLDREHCEFSYRDSIFKNDGEKRLVVLSVTLQLSTERGVSLTYPALKEFLTDKPEPSPQDVFEAVCSIRRSKLPDPAEIGNAGSFFKNPMISREKFNKLQEENPQIPGFDTDDKDLVKVPAAWFIEQAGWKGRRKEDAGVHEQHALVLVNYGQASGEQILMLAQDISNSVLQKFGIALQPEVQII